jgi:thioredoxin reductase (NADPH)
MATVDYIHHLAFPKLSDAEAKHLAGMATICDFKDGELVFQVGRRGLPLYLVESGAIAAGDESVTVAVHGPREFTGDVSLLTDRPATTSGYARGETRA